MGSSAALDILFAALPIVVLVALLAFRVKPLPAVLGAIAMLLLLWFRFPIGGTELLSMSGRLVEVTLNVVFILLGGLILSAFAGDSGAQQTMSHWFETAVKRPERAIIMYSLGLTPFMEASIGWGISLILAVPLLMRAGLSATRAATLGLIGLVVCPWGSLGPGLMITAELGEVGLSDLGAQTALYNLPVILSAALFVAVVGLGKRLTVPLALEILAVSFVMWAVLFAVSATIGPALAGIFAGLAVIAVLLLFARFQGARLSMTAAEARSFGPFAVLTGAMLGMIALTAAVDLGGWERLATSPGFWLVVSAATAPWFYGMRREPALVSVRGGAIRWVPVTITTVAYIVFGVLLSVSGMSGVLADGAAQHGLIFLLTLPFIGVLAGYLTSSITSVGTMLTLGVTDAALALGADPAAALGVQTAAAGGAVGASPSRLVLATSIANEAAQEAQAPVNYGRVALITLSMALLASLAMSVSIAVFPL